MKTKKPRYTLKVVDGWNIGDQWPFDTIEEVDEFIVDTRKSTPRIIRPGSMVLYKGRKKIGER